MHFDYLKMLLRVIDNLLKCLQLSHRLPISSRYKYNKFYRLKIEFLFMYFFIE